MIGVQAFVNLGGLTGLIPITGVTLPFVSYGGSSIVVLAISMGILVNVSMFTKYENKYKKKQQKKSQLKCQNAFISRTTMFRALRANTYR